MPTAEMVKDWSDMVSFPALVLIGAILLFAPIKDAHEMLITRRRELGLIFCLGALIRLTDLNDSVWVSTWVRTSAAVIIVLVAVSMAAYSVKKWMANHGN